MGQEEITVVELIADDLKNAKGNYGVSPTSEYHRLIRVMRPLNDLYGRKLAKEFGPLQFKAIRQQFTVRD